MTRALRVISIALITAGLVVIADAALTLVWKEPLSTVYGSIRQSQAAGELDRLEARFLEDVDLEAIEGLDVEAQARDLAAQFSTQIVDGEAIGRIGIDTLGLNAVVVEGTSTAALQKGPGHYPETALPGEGRTVAIAGHRTTYLAPFNELDQLGPGDLVVLEMPYGTFTYSVESTDIVDPGDVEVVDDVGYERLVLSACHPLYSAAQRIIAFARLERIELVGGAGSDVAPG